MLELRPQQTHAALTEQKFFVETSSAAGSGRTAIAFLSLLPRVFRLESTMAGASEDREKQSHFCWSSMLLMAFPLRIPTSLVT